MALGYGVDDGGQETGPANVLTTLAGGMYLLSLPVFVITLYLWPGMSDRVDQTWFGTAVWIALAIAIAVSPYALWPLAQRITENVRSKKVAP